MHRITGILKHLRSQSVAYLALFVALGGTSWAAVSIPNGSIGTAQIRNHSITPAKLAKRRAPVGPAAIVRYWAQINGSDTKVIAGSRGARAKLNSAALGSVSVSWGQRISRRCMPFASVAYPKFGWASAGLGFDHPNSVLVFPHQVAFGDTGGYVPGPAPLDVIVVCP